MFPNQVKVLNALKVSGRTKNGWGLGVLNAITEKTEAHITDTIQGSTRSEEVEPFFNYNILAADKQFNGNSSISIINSNVIREDNFRDANATALVSNILNNKNTYRVYNDLKMSQVNYQNVTTETGFSSTLFLSKIDGNLRYSIDHRFTDTKYNINDLGLNFRNNRNDFGADLSYQTFEPKGKLNNFSVSTFLIYNRLANPNVFMVISIEINYRAASVKLNSFGFNVYLEPEKQTDYFEFRNGSPFIYEKFVGTGCWFSSNYNKVLALDILGNMGTIFKNGRDLFTYDAALSPRVRFIDKLLGVYSISLKVINGDRGYAMADNETPIFGKRNRLRITNSLSGNYNFSSFHSLRLTFRHYWDTVAYDESFFTLMDNGRLTTDSGYTVNNVASNPNINFSTWNVDFNY